MVLVGLLVAVGETFGELVGLCSPAAEIGVMTNKLATPQQVMRIFKKK